jgi:hypothetical protein
MGAITGQKRGASVKKARHSIWNRHNQKVRIFKIKQPFAAMRKSGLVADLRQRSTKHSLGWPECQLPTQRDGWLARAAKVGSPPLLTSPFTAPNWPLPKMSQCCGAARHCGLSPQPRNRAMSEFTLCGHTGVLSQILIDDGFMDWASHSYPA